jgi:hypothetical protein
VQIIKFRKYYIELYGKSAFLEKYRNFDVIYKEYIITGTVLFIIVFLINFGFLLYLIKKYKLFKIENPEISNYTLILSGEDVPYINKNDCQNDELASINDKKTAIKNKILNLINVKEADVNYTLKLFDYYNKIKK